MKKSASAKSRRRPSKSAGERRGDLLANLDLAESAAVLQALLELRRDLKPDAERLARAIMQKVDVEAMARAVEDSVCSPDIEDLGARSGRRRGGYVEPTEAAGEILHEAVAPFLDNLRRTVDLRFREASIATCAGIVLGLYRSIGQSIDGPLAWAEDFPAEYACQAVTLLARRSKAGGLERWSLPQTFLRQVPEWAEMIGRVGKRR